MKTLQIVKNSKIFIGISVGLIILGILGMILVGGPKLSIDYQGGAEIEIGLPTNDYELSEIGDLVEKVTGKEVTVQKSEYDYDTSKVNANVFKETVKLDIRIQTSEVLTTEEMNAVSQYLIKKFPSIDEVPEPKYHEAKAPYVAHYELDCADISTTDTESYKQTMTAIQDDLRTLLSTEKETKKVGTDFSYIYGPDDLVITKYMVNIKVASTDSILSPEQLQAVKNAIQEKFDIVVSENPVDYNFSNVSPNVGREMLRNGIIAVVIAAVLMIIYIWIRFKAISGLLAGSMSVVALMHDIILMFLVYCIFGYTINESFVAAVLTILGYSINNTIVVFDRIRENAKIHPNMSIEEVVDTSVSQTLKRCVITSSCVLSSLVILFVFAVMNGLDSVAEFAFPIMIGNVCGFYSSVFIAPTLWAKIKTKKAK